MKRSLIFASIIAVLSLGAFTLRVADTFNVDSGKSKIIWTGQNVAGGKHAGEITISKGELVFDGIKLTGGSFTADVGSITVTDISGDKGKRLEDHLKNEDFFDAPKFPEAKFAVTKVTGSGSELTITGNLTIKNITKQITFPATVHKSADKVHAVAKGIKIDRTEFDVKYRSGNFFSGLGDRAISDEFVLDIEIHATK